MLTISLHIQFSLNGTLRCGEVQFFAQVALPARGEGEWAFQSIAVLRLYSEPHKKLLELSSQVVIASTLLDDLIVTDVKNIRSVVAMIPKKLTLPETEIEEERFCMVERPGLDISDLGVPYSVYTDDDDDDHMDDAE